MRCAGGARGGGACAPQVGTGKITFVTGRSQVVTWRDNALQSAGFEAVAPELPQLPRPGYSS